MHVAQSQRRRGVASSLLNHPVRKAQQKGMRRLSLETGAVDYTRAAHALYLKHGFVECAPFGGYQPDDASIFMTLDLR